MFNYKFLKIAVIVCLTSIFIACENITSSKNIDITLEASDYPVVLRYSQKHKLIWRIDIPVKATLKNKSFLRKTLGDVNYHFDKSIKYHSHIHDKYNSFVRIFDIENNRLKRNSKSKFLYYDEPKEFILYPYIKLDTTQNDQKLYKRYRGFFIQNDTDSLVIGTIKELSIKHPELIHFLNKGELYFEFRKNNSVQCDQVHKPISF